jgi:pyrimidine nucleoside transport protein
MTGGFATIAGTVLAAYINFGIDPAQLIAASVMAAPAALAVSKIFYPETEESKTTINDIKMEKGPEANVLDAAAQGASTAIMLVLNIAGSLIAFLSFVAFLNGIIGKQSLTNF